MTPTDGAAGLPLVVGLGPVDPALVGPSLNGHARFEPEPTAVDLKTAAGAIVRASYRVDQDLLNAMPHLRVIARTGVGTELIDLEAAQKRQVQVVITPGSNTNAVAEGTLAHVLHLVKSLGALHEIVAGGGWEERSQVPIGDLEGAGIGIVGFGRIGQRVAHLAEAFGMDVRAFDPVTQPPEAYRAGSMAELVAASRVITLHAPLTADTFHLVDARLLETVNPGTVLVNAGRGDLIDLDAAHNALRSGQLGGLGLDVYSEEPPPPHPIYHHPRVLLSPHVFGLSDAATAATLRDAAQGVVDVLSGKEARARVV